MVQFLKVCCSCALLLGVTCVSADQVQQNNKDNSAFLAPYFINWSATSKQYSYCNDQHRMDFGVNAGKHFILGDCPSFNAINLFYASTAIMHYAAANILPSRYSRMIKDSSVNFQVGIYKSYSSMKISMAF